MTVKEDYAIKLDVLKEKRNRLYFRYVESATYPVEKLSAYLSEIANINNRIAAINKNLRDFSWRY